jgi:hypothetical protein
MSNPSLSGGGGVSMDKVIVYLLGSNFSGTSSDAGEYQKSKKVFEVTD